MTEPIGPEKYADLLRGGFPAREYARLANCSLSTAHRHLRIMASLPDDVYEQLAQEGIARGESRTATMANLNRQVGIHPNHPSDRARSALKGISSDAEFMAVLVIELRRRAALGTGPVEDYRRIATEFLEIGRALLAEAQDGVVT